jgi:uncharacterized protein (DUF983 family)
VRNALVLLGRGIRKRCPRCGERKLWQSYFKIVDPCPTCGLKFERGDSEGHFLGAMMINLVVTEVVVVLTIVTGILATWPDVPWGTLLMVGIPVNTSFPVFFYPYSLTIWSAFELMLMRMDELSLPRSTFTTELHIPDEE